MSSTGELLTQSRKESNKRKNDESDNTNKKQKSNGNIAAYFKGVKKNVEVVTKPEEKVVKNKNAPKAPGKKQPNPETSGFWPNFKYMKFDRKFLELGDRYFQIENPVVTKEDLLQELGIKHESEQFSLEKANEVFRRIKQRSPAWFLARTMTMINVSGNDEHAKIVIGASSIAALTGLWCKRAKQYFHGKDYKYGDNNQFRECVKKEIKVFDRSARVRMEYGKQKEDDVLISLIQSLPDWEFFEIGSVLVPALVRSEYQAEKKKEPKIVFYVSPDIYFQDRVTGSHGSGEFKVPAVFSVTQKEGRFHFWEKDVYENPPEYYLTQRLAQTVGMHLETGAELGLFSCMTVNQGTRCWLYGIDWELWDMIVRVSDWVADTYIIGTKRILFDDDFDPFADCPFYDKYLELLEIHQTDYLKIKDYELKDEWVEPGFEYKFFDDEKGNDLRIQLSDEEKLKYEGCSAESVPRDPDPDDLAQTTLFDYM